MKLSYMQKEKLTVSHELLQVKVSLAVNAWSSSLRLHMQHAAGFAQDDSAPAVMQAILQTTGREERMSFT
jgi:hypothetical protein